MTKSVTCTLCSSEDSIQQDSVTNVIMNLPVSQNRKEGRLLDHLSDYKRLINGST